MISVHVSEKEIQKTILDYLMYLENAGDVYYFRNNSFAGKFERVDGSQGFIKNNKKGMPDIIVCYKGYFIGLEVKTAKGEQSIWQVMSEAAIKSAGGQYFIVRSLDDVQNIFIEIDRGEVKE